MKPQTITKNMLPYPFTDRDIWEWLKANGVRHYVPEGARIIITGNWIIVPTFDIGRVYNPNYWNRPRTSEIPIKVRKYRLRHELTLSKGR